MTSRDAVVISGFGVVSPLGCSVDELTWSFATGERAAQIDGGIPVADVPLDLVPADHGVRIGRLDRLCRFFLAASYLALGDAGVRIEACDRERVGLSFGTGLGCLVSNEEYYRKVVEQGPSAASPRVFAYTVSSAAAGEVSIALGIQGPNLTSHMGLAAGLGAIAYGCDLIRLGKADLVLAGGADVIGESILSALAEMRLLKDIERAHPFGQAVPGICPGEAAVVAVLERPERVDRSGKSHWGTVEGYTTGFDPHLTRPTGEPGVILETLRRALRSSGRSTDEVGLLLSSAHGTVVDETLRASMRSLFGADHDALVIAPKAVSGETFGAAGVLGLALAAGLMRHRPKLADTVGFGVDGRSLDGRESTRRLGMGTVAAIESTCYSGNVASLIFASS